MRPRRRRAPLPLIVQVSRAVAARVTVTRAIAAALTVGLGALGACTEEATTPGQLVVAIDTDMALPDQIDTIELQVSANGTTLLDYPMPVGVGTDAQPIPATLTLVAGADPSTPVTIRVSASKNGAVRTLRQVITTVPSGRVATLRMPVQWLCDGSAQAVPGPNGSTQYQSTCGANATCQAGECVESQVPETTLADYQPQGVFGGGAAPPSKGQTTGTCFDTVPCMVSGNVEGPDDQCSVSLPQAGAGASAHVNVALRVADDGICDTTGTTCFVPLDGDSDEGWTTQAGRIALPPAVCAKLRTGLVAGVVVSTTCATKTVADPPCGPWSSVAPALDASTATQPDATPPPTTPTLLASAVPDGGTSQVCCPLLADATKLYTCLCGAGPVVDLVTIDPSTGTTTTVGGFTPRYARSQYAMVLAGGDVYWVDRVSADGGVGDACPVYGTAAADAGTGPATAVVQGDVYDGADLLADATNLYALADNVSGLAATASAVQALRIDRATGVVTPLDTGGARAVLQFTQDATAVYVGVDTDIAAEGGVERVSRIVQFPKAGGASTTLVQRTLTTSDPNHGGFIGLQDDGATLFALYEAAPAADGTVDTQAVSVDLSGGATTTLYDSVVDPAVTSLRLLGAVNGALLLVRHVSAQIDAGVSAAESGVLVVPASGGAPRIVASFTRDQPLFEVQAPTFSRDVFWINASGSIFQLPAAALR